jgi:hypothetical protein
MPQASTTTRLRHREGLETELKEAMCTENLNSNVAVMKPTEDRL